MILKKFFSYALFSVIASAMGFITSIYLAKVLSPSELGVIGLFQAFVFISIPLSTFSSLGLVSVNKVKMDEKDYQRFADTYFSIGILMSLLMGVIALGLYPFFTDYLWILLVIPVYALIKVFSDFHGTELVQMHQANRYGMYTVAESMIGLLVTVMLISYFHFSWEGRMIALFIGAALVLWSRYRSDFVIMLRYRFTLDPKETKQIFHYGWPLMIAMGAGWLLNNADRFIVLHYFSLNEVGIYTLAYSLGSMINVVNQATINAIAPTIYKRLHDKSARMIVAKYNLYYGLFIISVALIIGISAYWYIPWFFGDKYPQSETIILLVALAFGFNGIYRTTGLVIDFFQATKLKTVLLYVSASIGIACSIILIPVFGFIAPGFGMLLAYVILAVLSYIYGWKLINENGVQ